MMSDEADTNALRRRANSIDVEQATLAPQKAEFVAAVYATLAAGLDYNALAIEIDGYGESGYVEGSSALGAGDHYRLALDAWYRLQNTVWPSHLVAEEAQRWADGVLRADRTPTRPVPGDIDDLQRTLDGPFADETLSDADKPTALRSAVSALCVQDQFGGRLVGAIVGAGSGRVNHTWNLLDDGREVDVTRHRFHAWAPGKRSERTRSALLADADVAEQYEDLRELIESFSD